MQWQFRPSPSASADQADHQALLLDDRDPEPALDQRSGGLLSRWSAPARAGPPRRRGRRHRRGPPARGAARLRQAHARTQKRLTPGEDLGEPLDRHPQRGQVDLADREPTGLHEPGALARLKSGRRRTPSGRSRTALRFHARRSAPRRHRDRSRLPGRGRSAGRPSRPPPSGSEAGWSVAPCAQPPKPGTPGTAGWRR